jgi:BASS family bile acid:Na+ symporter
VQADLLTKVILPLSLFLIMYGIGISLRIADFRNVMTAPTGLAVGLLGQMLLLPLTAFGLAVVLQLPPEIAVGLIIIALAPGGATSNMFTYLFRGDVSLSISLTAVVSLVTPFHHPGDCGARDGLFPREQHRLLPAGRQRPSCNFC